MEHPTTPVRGAMSVPDFSAWAGICKSKIYELISAGEMAEFGESLGD